MKKSLFVSLIFLTVCLLISNVSAIHFDNCRNGDLTLTYIDNDAGYNNEFGFVTPTPYALHALGAIHDVSIGTEYPIGVYSEGDISIYIKSPDNHVYESFQTADDGFIHTHYIIESDGSWTIGFEDLYGLGDQDFNDVTLNVACKPVPIPTPEFPSAAFPAALLVGLLGIVIFVRDTNKK